MGSQSGIAGRLDSSLSLGGARVIQPVTALDIGVRTGGWSASIADEVDYARAPEEVKIKVHERFAEKSDLSS
jgi:hypothetical protein